MSHLFCFVFVYPHAVQAAKQVNLGPYRATRAPLSRGFSGLYLDDHLGSSSSYNELSAYAEERLVLTKRNCCRCWPPGRSSQPKQEFRREGERESIPDFLGSRYREFP